MDDIIAVIGLSSLYTLSIVPLTLVVLCVACFKKDWYMAKRIYVVIEFNGLDAMAQGAFETEESAYEAMENWSKGKSSSFVVTPCTLHSLWYVVGSN